MPSKTPSPKRGKSKPRYSTRYPIQDHTQTFAFKLYLLEAVVLLKFRKCFIDRDTDRCGNLNNDYEWIKDEVKNHSEFNSDNKRYKNAEAVYNAIGGIHNLNYNNLNQIKNMDAYKDLLQTHNNIKNNEFMENINNQLHNISQSNALPNHIRNVAYILQGDEDFKGFIGGSSLNRGSRKFKTRKTKTRKTKTRKTNV